MPKKKRSFGQIDKLPSGKYRARYTGPDGLLHKAPATFFARDDASAWLRQEQKLLEFDEWTPPALRDVSQEDKKLTVGDWMRRWLDIQENQLAPSTMQNYRDTVNRRILDVDGQAARLRDVGLLSLTRRDVADWWDAINADFDSATYNRAAYTRLKTAMNAAVDREIIPLNPVALKAAKKRKPAKRKELPETTTLQSIVDELDPPHKIVAILTLFHGLRIGEALALRRRDIITTDDTITVKVRGNCYRKPGEGMIRKDTAKTEAGHRDVPVFPRFYSDIHRHLRVACGDSPDAMICTTATGKIIMDTSYRSVLKRAKERAGITETITPHYGRVWLITALAEAGMTIPAIGHILGQKDLKTITEIYMRGSDSRQVESLARIDEVLSSAMDTSTQEKPESAESRAAIDEEAPAASNVIDFRTRRKRSS